MALTKASYSMINGAPANVLDFGAVGDGIANDSAAFAAALATGRPVYAPAGTYKASVSLSSNQCIYGDGPRKTILIPPAGALYVALIDASSSAKQNVQLIDLCFKNPNNVANCVGIWFAGVDVNSINDHHILTNLEIGPSGWEGTSYPFANGIYATGRLISLLATNVYLSKNNVNWRSTTDPSTPAFNANVFNQCIFADAELQGFLHTGQSTNVKFIGGYTQNNNTTNTVSCAGMDISDIFNWDIDTHGFEANGFGVPVNGSVPTSNSISLLVQGTICINLVVHGCYFTSSGTNIALGATLTTVTGGKIENNYLNCLTNGFNFVTLSQSNSETACRPIIFSSTNQCNGKISFFTSGIGINAACEQNQGMGYLTATVSDIDLLQTCNFICNPAAPFTISAIANRLPGCELMLINTYGSSTVTVAGSLMQGGVASNVLTGTIAKFKVQGGPNPGLFVRIQ